MLVPVIGIAIWAAIVICVIGLCRMAARGDRQLGHDQGLAVALERDGYVTRLAELGPDLDAIHHTDTEAA